uniref:Uncharacterized protein n=1 Tax=Avena sativa TaxID=4498 RepID=A0ACD6A8V8_AVESA
MACRRFLFVILMSSSCLAAADEILISRPAAAQAALTFGEGYTQLFGESNLRLHGDGKRVHISLDERTGSGFASQRAYLHGLFSASIKLPSADYTAGVVVAFYMSNGGVYEKTHDELDFEFLGNVKGKGWRVQTNVYGDGSTALGREERYGRLWFDPTQDFHRYAILWTNNTIVFYIDATPIREVVRNELMGAQFPSKPMSVYATIWDGSSWATSGGRYKVDYSYAPYVAQFTDLMLQPAADHDARPRETMMVSPAQRAAMERVRARHLTYGYCYDRARYPAPLPECRVGAEAAMYLPSGQARSRRNGKRHRRAGGV